MTAATGAVVRPPRTAYDRLGHIIAVGAGQAEVRALLDEGAARIRLTVVTEPGSRP